MPKKYIWDCPFTVREHSNDDKLEKSVATFRRELFGISASLGTDKPFRKG
jgi:hypothetical protein